MTVRNLEYLFTPRSIAPTGASSRPGSVGSSTAKSPTSGEFSGIVWPVNPQYRSIEGRGLLVRRTP
jgi:acetyltransferase